MVDNWYLWAVKHGVAPSYPAVFAPVVDPATLQGSAPMRLGVGISVTVVVLLTIAMLTLSGWSRPPVDTIQRGFRGLGMELVYNPRTVAQELEANQVPPSSKPTAGGRPDRGQGLQERPGAGRCQRR